MPLTAVSGWHWPAADSRQEAAVAQGEKAGNSFFGRSSFEDDIPSQQMNGGPATPQLTHLTDQVTEGVNQ